ncbi:isomerase [Streptomyces sp. NPDC088923]|uniref:isomerase n=1 Tax=Streptomyces sp. NPDC088923 TaxID=3365913 RepID=UPI00381FCD1B
MPHITVDYTERLDDTLFDRRAFAKELDPLVVTESHSAGVGKIFFRPAPLTFVSGEEHPYVHVTVALLPNRSPAQKAHLSDAVLALLGRYTAGGPHVVTSVEVRDLPDSYRLRS